MSRFADYFFAICITLWVGALWAIGYISAPVLFENLADRSLAGDLAGKQFSLVAWLGMFSGVYGLLFLFSRHGVRGLKLPVLWLIIVMFLLTLAGHFGVQPIMEQLRDETPREVMQSVLRNRFIAWHGIASVLYLIQSVLGIALVTQIFAPR